jgi:hypothetical protein
MAHMMITDVPIFDRDLRKASTLRPVTITDVRGYIKAHYLRRAPAVVRLCLLAELAGEPFGCVVYSEAPAESSKRLGGYTWELARLYAEDWMPRNTETWMIGRSIRYIKQRHPDVRHLISYAAPGMRDATGAEGSKRIIDATGANTRMTTGAKVGSMIRGLKAHIAGDTLRGGFWPYAVVPGKKIF